MRLSRTTPGPLALDWKTAAWTTIGLIVVFSALTMLFVSSANPARTIGSMIQPQVISWGLWLLLLPIVFMTSSRVHRWGLLSVRGVALHVAAAFALAAVHSVTWGLIRGLFQNPAGRPVLTVVGNWMSFLYSGDVLRYVLFAAAYHVLAYRVEARDHLVREAQLKARLAEARLDALEARLHPHFLFNTLNTVSALIRTDPQSAITVVEHLGDLLRAALRAEPGREVSVATELELLRRYVDIQQARFRDRLSFVVRAAPDIVDAFVPQMVLQPLVENAVQHGIAPREASGLVTVEASRRDGMLRLRVSDDGVGFGQGAPTLSTKANGTGIGLANTHARLSELYGDRYTMDISPAHPTGTTVTIELPYHTAPLRVETAAR